MNSYLVIGLYDNNGQRWADTVYAEDPKEAEALAIDEHPDLTIAGVVLQDVKCPCGKVNSCVVAT